MVVESTISQSNIRDDASLDAIPFTDRLQKVRPVADVQASVVRRSTRSADQKALKGHGSGVIELVTTKPTDHSIAIRNRLAFPRNLGDRAAAPSIQTEVVILSAGSSRKLSGEADLPRAVHADNVHDAEGAVSIGSGLIAANNLNQR